MEFRATTPNRRGPIRLQFYRNPPIETIELSELEQLAVDRMLVLKCLETVKQDFNANNRDYEEQLITHLSKLGPFGKSLTLTTSSAKNVKEDIRRDVISHFLLQVAYCRSEDLRRWFIQQEVELFRFRFLLERNNLPTGPGVISDFLVENRLHFSYLSDSERSHLQQQLLAGTAYLADVHSTSFYKVYFTKVPDLVRHRRVFVRGGFAYVPDSELVSLVVSQFRANLSCNLARLGLTFGCRIATEENRVLPLLSSLSQRYLGEDYSNKPLSSDIVKAEQVDSLARQPGVFPPCMSQLHEALKANHHLRHAGRMQYGLFLKGIGLPLDEALKFWRNSFAPKYDSEQFAKSYAYNIRHNYGKEGKRADYTPYSCIRIITSSAPGPGDYHGCPFRHMDPEILRQRLSSRMSTESVDLIVQRAKERLYHLSCREYFRAMHKLDSEAMSGLTISHPNQYFEESQKLLRDGHVKTSTAKVRVSKVKLTEAAPDASVIESTLMDEDIDDTILSEIGTD